MKSDKHRWREIAKHQKRRQKLSEDGQPRRGVKSGSGDCSKWKKQRHQLRDMDINDLEQYVIDTEYDSE